MANDPEVMKVRQRVAVAEGKNPGLPAPSKTPRFKKGGSIDKTVIKNYGSGVRKHAPKAKSGRGK